MASSSIERGASLPVPVGDAAASRNLVRALSETFAPEKLMDLYSNEKNIEQYKGRHILSLSDAELATKTISLAQRGLAVEILQRCGDTDAAKELETNPSSAVIHKALVSSPKVTLGHAQNFGKRAREEYVESLRKEGLKPGIDYNEDTLKFTSEGLARTKMWDPKYTPEINHKKKVWEGAQELIKAKEGQAKEAALSPKKVAKPVAQTPVEKRQDSPELAAKRGAVSKAKEEMESARKKSMDALEEFDSHINKDAEKRGIDAVKSRKDPSDKGKELRQKYEVASAAADLARDNYKQLEKELVQREIEEQGRTQKLNSRL